MVGGDLTSTRGRTRMGSAGLRAATDQDARYRSRDDLPPPQPLVSELKEPWRAALTRLITTGGSIAARMDAYPVHT
jgi:hypothetical protein